MRLSTAACTDSEARTASGCAEIILNACWMVGGVLGNQGILSDFLGTGIIHSSPRWKNTCKRAAVLVSPWAPGSLGAQETTREISPLHSLSPGGLTLLALLSGSNHLGRKSAASINRNSPSLSSILMEEKSRFHLHGTQMTLIKYVSPSS